MNSVLSAELAILVELKSVWVILFVFVIVIISLFAFCTFKSNFGSHKNISPKKLTPPKVGAKL